MKRKFAAAILACLMTVALVTSAYAAEARAVLTPSLTFSGTTAYCEIKIVQFGAAIDATLELWSGNTLLASWSGTGTSRVIISKTKTVTRGQSYTLEVHGTVGDETIDAPSITKTCP